MYKDSPPTGNMYEAIKTLAKSSASDKIKNLAKSIVGDDSTQGSTTIEEALSGKESDKESN